ncbi:MAG: hypothetical protein A3K19_05475 [Lentisphaerae bacterium RIFOXYB12_FULL_65_16]|nr:MAG: hypothetical protein A3K18_15745 [Lentisphaerae bacterium RIFOXYA12_64_32]OGV94342.1 MAG: hypothetical protein A3K19_05475 [Lentisphaerae bacterium RIFOXYB12_FULL_65_16]
MTQQQAQSVPDLSRVVWHLADAGAPLPTAFTAPPPPAAEWHLVKQNTRRTVYRVAAAGAAFFVKHDHPRRLQDRVTCLWRCKAEQEFRAGQVLAAAEVAVVRFLGWGRKGLDSFLVSEALPGAVGFVEAWAVCRGVPARRRAFVTGLAQFLKTLSETNVDHPDLHTGNVLVTGTGEGARDEGRGAGADGGPPLSGAGVGFHLVDVYGARAGVALNRVQGLQILGLALALGRELEPAEGAAILEPLGLSPGPAESALTAACWRGLVHDFFRRVHQFWPGRKRRLLGASSLCEAHRTSEGRWLLRRPFPLPQAQAAFEQHLANVAARKDMIKDDVKRQLSRVRVGETTFVVKEFFRVPPGPDVLRPDRAAWLNAYRLEMAHVPCAACHGWLRAADGRGFLVLEDLGLRTLLARLEERPSAAERRRLMDGAGRLTAWLHGAGMAPGDWTAANLMLASKPGFGAMPLAVVDYDRILFYPGEVPVVRRARNLRQLLELLRPLVPADDAARLIEVYGAEAALGEAEVAYYVASALG